MKIKARAVSEELMGLLRQDRYCVHSSFEKGINLQADDYLSFVGNKLDEKLPFGVLLDSGDVKALKAAKRIFWWNQDGQILTDGELEISLEGAAVYSSYYDKRNDADWNMREVFQPVYNEVTGFGCTIGELADRQKCTESIDSLQSSFQSSDRDEVRGALKTWIGAGPGLTPSGDDFLTGIILINQIRKILGSVFLEVIKEMASVEYTTAVSVNQYRCSLQGYFSSSMIAFADAYVDKNSEKLRECVNRLLHYGHTSGRDMVAGMYLGLTVPVLR